VGETRVTFGDHEERVSTRGSRKKRKIESERCNEAQPAGRTLVLGKKGQKVPAKEPAISATGDLHRSAKNEGETLHSKGWVHRSRGGLHANKALRGGKIRE